MTYGSDLIVDLLVAHGVEHVAFNPGATFRGIHDSLVNHRDDAPAILLCPHEGISVAVAQGYAKAAGKPMAVLLHDVVGLQQATMAVYNAWCDRVPILLLGGTGPMSTTRRRPWIDWIHTALVQGELVRDYVKWDDQPADLSSVPESLARACNVAVTAPPGPVYVCFDTELQEQEAGDPVDLPSTGAYAVPRDPAPAPDDVAWLADRCRQARLPVLVTDYAGATDRGFALLGQVAELLQAPVLDAGARCCFPTTSPLNFSGLEEEVLAAADLIVAVDVEDLAGTLGPQVWETNGGSPVRARPGVAVAHLTPQHYKLRSWTHDYQRLLPLDRHISCTAETGLGALCDALQDGPVPPATLQARRAAVADRRAARREAWWAEARVASAEGSVPPARLAAELWPLLADRRWTLAHGSLDGWERRLWDFERPRQHLGWHGGGGLGYGLGASIGAALALGDDTLCIDLQPDGDFLYTPAALWTLAHAGLPVLIVMHNNRQYGNTVGHAQRMVEARDRSSERRYVGASLADPPVDYAGVARGFGVWATGPVTAPEAVAPAVEAALEVIRAGRPALVDVITTGS